MSQVVHHHFFPLTSQLDLISLDAGEGWGGGLFSVRREGCGRWRHDGRGVIRGVWEGVMGCKNTIGRMHHQPLVMHLPLFLLLTSFTVILMYLR